MRKLTGKWHLKKTFWGWKVMVQIQKTSMDKFDFSLDPVYTIYTEATLEDLEELGITIK